MAQTYTVYNLDSLQQEYKSADLQPKKLELVTDEEVSIFLNDRHVFWEFYGCALFILIFVLAGVFGR